VGAGDGAAAVAVLGGAVVAAVAVS
jgi:hypothetical protein